MKLPYLFSWLDTHTEEGLLYENIETVHWANIRLFRYLMLHLGWIQAVLGFVGIFLNYGWPYSTFYWFQSAISILFFFIYRSEKPWVIRRSALLIHMCTLIFYFLGIFLSVYSPYGSPHEAVTFTCLLLALPVLYIDKSLRVIIETIFVFVIHVILSFWLKPRPVAILDLLDTTVFALMGTFLGGYIRLLRLESFHKDKILIKQRDTDVLTGLSNRRVLFSKLDELLDKPVEILNVVMMDIDFFKQFNDTYGHQDGDECLATVELAMRQFGREHNLTFCRYGGEEFTAIGAGIPEEEFGKMVEQLLQKVRDLQIPFVRGVNGFVSLSAGYTAIKVLPEYLPEDYIKIADDALYEAKTAGRNRAVLGKA
ncbi:MAG: GGDEF domain-containing protein [Treponema sp.]|nr:GGDEF domain-containing protein [Treponema sp.]